MPRKVNLGPKQDPTGMRVKDYPAAGDQFDEIWRALEALAGGKPLPKTTTDMIARVKQTKTTFPKRGPKP